MLNYQRVVDGQNRCFPVEVLVNQSNEIHDGWVDDESGSGSCCRCWWDDGMLGWWFVAVCFAECFTCIGCIGVTSRTSRYISLAQKHPKTHPAGHSWTAVRDAFWRAFFWAKWRAMKAIEGHWRLSGYIHQWCVDIVDVSTIDWLIGSDWHVSSFKRVKWRGCFHSISRLLWWDVRRETFPELPGSGSRVTKKVLRAWPFFVCGL